MLILPQRQYMLIWNLPSDDGKIVIICMFVLSVEVQ